MTRIRKLMLWTLCAGAVLFITIQFIPVDRNNPPITQTISAPTNVKAILRKSCFDCHSNEVRWPWYSRVAPASWLIARDVRLGRDEVNYSEWDRYSAEEQAELIHESYESCAEGEMPMKIYIALHPDAKLSAADLGALRAWADASGRSRDEHERNDD